MSSIRIAPLRTLAVTALIATCATAMPRATDAAAPSGGDLRAKILAAYAKVTSYRLTVLGSVRSSGVFVAPDKYEVTTDIEGQRVLTVILNGTYWIKNSNGKGWTKSGTTSSLDADIAGIVRSAKAHASTPFAPLPDQTQNGKKVGTFRYATAGGNEETCNYDLSTYLATRCRQDELTILYSDYNDAALKVENPS